MIFWYFPRWPQNSHLYSKFCSTVLMKLDKIIEVDCTRRRQLYSKPSYLSRWKMKMFFALIEMWAEDITYKLHLATDQQDKRTKKDLGFGAWQPLPFYLLSEWTVSREAAPAYLFGKCKETEPSCFGKVFWFRWKSKHFSFLHFLLSIHKSHPSSLYLCTPMMDIVCTLYIMMNLNFFC